MPDSQEIAKATRFLRRLVPVILTAALILSGASTVFAEKRDGEVSTAAAEIKHVFVIVLENKSYSDTFGTSTQDPYLQPHWCPWAAY
jgi:phosphatidylinositol-3-phosphatase